MTLSRTLLLLALLFTVGCFSGPLVSDAVSQTNDDCLMCHSKEGPGPQADVTNLQRSAHKVIACVACHSDASDLPHPNRLKSVTCGKCHSPEARAYLSDKHGIVVGANRPQAQACGDCHGKPHAILPVSDPQAPAYRARIPILCAGCHDNPQRMSKAVLVQPQPYRSYMNSVHGKAYRLGVKEAPVCTDCHGAHSLLSSSNPESKIFRQHIPQTCGRCHTQIEATLRNSVHGRAFAAGIEDAPVCIDCHGEHLISSSKEPSSMVYPTSIKKTCGACHEAERITSKYGLPVDRMVTYEGSYHGLAGRYGETLVANCASCHGHHDILPSSDPASMVNKANLAKNCGKCHPGAGARLAQGYVHSTPGTSRTPIVRYVVVFYLVVILFTIGGMVVHNFLDFRRKLTIHLGITRRLEKAHRLLRSERIQHVGLMITFVVLAYTGFAIKYPEAKWAWPLRLFERPDAVRGLIHRSAAGVFIGLALYHTWFILFTAAGRQRVRELLPGLRDFKDFASLTRHNLGLSRERPRFSTFSYIEKSEYWALMWGSVIMIASGLLLTFANLTLRYFPLWVSELATTVHFYEAVLATLAIVVWHLYWTIFDIEIYPMNWSWMTGRITEQQLEERESDVDIEHAGASRSSTKSTGTENDFWHGRTPCWVLRECPVGFRCKCPAFADRSVPCWKQEHTLCDIVLNVPRTCDICVVYKTNVEFYEQTWKKHVDQTHERR